MDTLQTAEHLRRHGFAVHWLRPRSKAPVLDGWSEAPVASEQDLLTSYRDGYNVGVRPGEYSRVAGGYLHIFDMDIRLPDLADEAWDALAALFPNVDLDSLPCVLSGSGGESRHLYLITEKPFRKKALAKSEDKYLDRKTGKWRYAWEIDLFGTDTQVALPPSIHPDTRRPYEWLREFDFDLLPLGVGPFVAAADIEAIVGAQEATYDFEAVEPKTFKPGQLERTLDDIPDWRIDDRDSWIALGQALHHQFGGSDEGFRLWMKHSARGSKFLVDSSERAELRRYRGFGRNRKRPVTMATIVEWAQEARVAALRDAFDELPDEDDEEIASEPQSSAGSDGATGTKEITSDDFDALLGGDEDDDEESDLDLLGGGKAADEEFAHLEWISLLDLSEDKGAIKPTLHNVKLLVANDPRLIGLPALNEFTQETVQRSSPGVKPPRRKNAAKPTPQLDGRIWEVKDTLNGDLWSDDKDFAIRSILEAPTTQGGYGVKISDRDLKAAVVLAANQNPFHPVREYLEGLQWDGAPRVETLFTDYVGAPDDAYSRSVSRLMMVAAVARIFEPGCKWDHAVILEGMQGKRKSTFIQVLAKSWFGELNAEFSDTKVMIEQMQGKWIMEIPELSGFSRADVRSIKAFISCQADRARLAYARRAGEYPRQSIFIGSTNDREYLKDDSGGRRFWPIYCSVESIDIEALRENVDQLWGEAVALYRQMREDQPHGGLPLYLTDEAAANIAARLQESRRIESADDGWLGRIQEWLTSPIITGSVDDDLDELGQPRYRDVTCLMEIWFDCLGQVGKYQTADGNMLARIMARIPGWESDGTQQRFAKWGKQRAYRRVG